MLLKKMYLKSLMFMLIMSVPAVFVAAQEKDMSNFSEIESILDENMEYQKTIQKIVKEYPGFSYEYKMEDGEITSVTVTGVENERDKKKLEVVILDLKSNMNEIKNKANRMGVFYSVDEDAEFKMGEDALQSQILKSLEYPESAKNWGVEGTIYLKFVVDENGKIPFATASEDIDTEFEFYVEDLEDQAISALKQTSGEWEPGAVAGEKVPTLVLLPVTFDFQKDPSIPALIR